MTLEQQSELFLSIDTFVKKKMDAVYNVRRHDTCYFCRLVIKSEMTNYLLQHDTTKEELFALGENLFDYLYTSRGVTKLWKSDRIELTVQSEVFPFNITLGNMDHYLKSNGFEFNAERKVRLREWLIYMKRFVEVTFQTIDTPDPENTIETFNGVFYQLQLEHYFIETNDLFIVFKWLMEQWKRQNSIFSNNPAFLKETYLVNGSRPFILKHPKLHESNIQKP